MINKLNNKLKLFLFIIIGTHAIQYFPVLLENLVIIPLSYVKPNYREWRIDIQTLPPGKYYFSGGRTYVGCDLFLDKNKISSTRSIFPEIISQIFLGGEFQISNVPEQHPKEIVLSCFPQSNFLTILYHNPAIARFHSGLTLHCVRVFADFLMGPLFSALLLFSIFLINPIISTLKTRSRTHFVIFAITSFLYSISASHLFSLYLSVPEYMFIHYLTRTAFSGAFIFLCGSYSKQHKFLLSLHAVAFILITVWNLFNCENTWQIYYLCYPLFPVATAVASISLLKKNGQENFESTLGIMGVSWSILQFIDTLKLWFSLGPFLNPAFVVLLTALLTYHRHKALLKQQLITDQLQMKLKNQEELFLLSSQISHDIRSPLAALNVLEGEILEFREETRVLVRSAVNRIRDIANSLLEKNRIISNHETSGKNCPIAAVPVETSSVHLISSLLDQIITEKRIQFRSKIGIEIEAHLSASCYGHFALIQPGEFKRVISNLINNSVEAMGDIGRVLVSLTGGDEKIQIEIQDNGKGIPEEILPKLMLRGETHGKIGGSGLGLYHAKTTLESWQGSLSLSSSIDVGTTVTITLPKGATPDWFVPSVDLMEGGAVVVLDDDSSIHQIWQNRIEAVAAGASVKIIHCSTSQEVEEWVTRSTGAYKAVLYLFDFELLGDKKNGLDLIEDLQLQKNATLVTSRYEEATVRERCEKLGVRLIPKGMAGFVPISISNIFLRLDGEVK